MQISEEHLNERLEEHIQDTDIHRYEAEEHLQDTDIHMYEAEEHLQDTDI